MDIQDTSFLTSLIESRLVINLGCTFIDMYVGIIQHFRYKRGIKVVLHNSIVEFPVI